MPHKTEDAAITKLDEAAVIAQERITAAARKAQKMIDDACEAATASLQLSAAPGHVQRTVGFSSNNVSYRIIQAEKDIEKHEKLIDNLIDRMISREVAVSPTEIQRALQTINSHADTLFKCGESLAKLEHSVTMHMADDYARFEKISERLEKMQLKSQVYYSTISPEKIQDAVELGHKNEMAIAEMRKRYDEFIEDRILRLERTNKDIDAVKETAIAVENRVMDVINKNQIRSQQYVIGVVVGIIITFLSSIVFAYLKF